MSSLQVPTKQSPTPNAKSNRLPAPSLFVGPPSRNASQLSVLRPTPEKPTRDPLARHKSNLSRKHTATSAYDEQAAGRPGNSLRKTSERSVDIRWREMQNTLNEVELTAQSSMHIFGDNHAKALDDLRAAQVELARAWGRGSEKNGANEHSSTEPVNQESFGAAGKISEERKTRSRANTAASASTVLSDSSVRSDETTRSGRSQLEEDTAEDIKKASERRGQNEAYFKMVQRSVHEVVEKLEVVATAMREVEGESRSLWSQSTRSSVGLER